MSGLADSADALLDTPQGQRYFRHVSPVDMSGSAYSGLLIQDKYRHLNEVLKEDQALGEMAARGARNEATELDAERSIFAMRNEAAVLAELDRIDPFEDGFEEKAKGFTQMATLSPAVGRAYDQKMRERGTVMGALGDLASSAAEAGLTDEEFTEQQTTARDLLKRGDMEGYGRLIFRNEQLSRSYAERRRLDQIRKETELRQSLQEPEVDTRAEEAMAKYHRDHLENVSKIELPQAAVNLDPDFFNDEMAGDPDRLPKVVGDFVSDTLLNTAFDFSSGSGVFEFPGFDRLENVLSGDALTSPEALRDFLMTDENSSRFMAQLANDVATMSKDRFVATYGATTGTEDPTTGALVGPNKEDVDRVKGFLSGLHDEVKSILEFSREKQAFRGGHPEFAKKAQELRADRVEASKKKAVSDAEKLQENISNIIKNANL